MKSSLPRSGRTLLRQPCRAGHSLQTQPRRALSVQVAVAAQGQRSDTEDAAPTASHRDLDVPANGFDSVPDALAAIAAGEFVLVLDDEDRENEGDLIIAADKVTPEKIAYMVEHTSGVLCVGMRGSDCDRLQLPQMVSSSENEEEMATAFTVTCDLRVGVTTGISASDRSATIAALGNHATVADDLRKPGHVFPLRAREGGVLVRPGHTEAAVDLSYFSGSYPAGLLCEVVDRTTGEMARTPYLQAMAAEHGVRIITIADLVRYRLKREVLVAPVTTVPLDTRLGEFQATSFRSLLNTSQEHLALTYGDVRSGRPLVRIHQEDAVGDTFGVEMCSSQPELDASMKAIKGHGSGVLVYLTQQKEKGPRLSTNLMALGELQSFCEVDTDGKQAAQTKGRSDLDVRDFGSVHSMLMSLKVDKAISLISDRSSDAEDLVSFGYDVEQVSLRDLL